MRCIFAVESGSLATSGLIMALLGALLCVASARASSPFPTNDDPANQIRFHTQGEADAKRQQLVCWIWPEGLPAATLPRATEDIEFPAIDLNGVNPSLVRHVDKLDADVSKMDFHAILYLLHPVNKANANRLVIVQAGHTREANQSMVDGIGTTANRVLEAGYTVLASQMPLCGWNADETITAGGQTYSIAGRASGAHGDIFKKLGPPTLPDGGFLRLFLEPLVQAVNHWQQSNPSGQDISMIGLSGGGWTTAMMAAMDSRITLSVQVAGTAPLYAWNKYLSPGGADAEQAYPPLYREDIAPDGSGGGVATWMECYALGAYGMGRRQIMVTVFREPVGLFPGPYPDTFKDIVSNFVKDKLEQGRWEHVYDHSEDKHQVSNWAIENVILPALAQPTHY